MPLILALFDHAFTTGHPVTVGMSLGIATCAAAVIFLATRAIVRAFV